MAELFRSQVRFYGKHGRYLEALTPDAQDAKDDFLPEIARKKFLFKTRFPLIQTKDISTVVVIIRDFGSGDVVPHFRVEPDIPEPARVAVGTDTDIKLRGILQS